MAPPGARHHAGLTLQDRMGGLGTSRAFRRSTARLSVDCDIDTFIVLAAKTDLVAIE